MNSESLRRRLVIPLITLFTCAAQLGCDALLGAQGRIARAQAAPEAGDYVAAMVDAKAALQSEPDEVTGRFPLARGSGSVAQVVDIGMSTGR